MKHASKFLVAGLVASLYAATLTPCFGGKPQTKTGENIDFKTYKTYSWLPTRVLTKSGEVMDEPTVTPTIRNSVNREMTARGFREVPEGGDLQVAVSILTSAVPQLEAVFMPGPQLYYGTPVATMGRYNRAGTLAINLIDSRTKKFAWAGLVSENVDNKPGAGVKKIDPAVRKLFGKFPVQAMKQ